MMTVLPPRRAPTAPSTAALRPRGALGLAAAALLLWPAPLSGQASPGPGPGPEERRRPTVEATVFGGVLAPLRRLTADPQTFETEISSSGLVGAEMTWWSAGRLGLAAQFVWAPARLSLIPTDFTGALPEELGDADYLAASGDVRYRLPVPPEVADLLRPYLALGAGVRRLGVDPIASPEVEDATDPMATAAAGSHVRLGADLGLRVEVRDRLSLYHGPTSGEGRLQNDLAITVGLGMDLR